MASTSPTYPLQGQVALVTGATGGIGLATSRLLASMGCSIGIHFNSDEKTAEALQSELTEQYSSKTKSKFVVSTADMNNYEDVCLKHNSRDDIVWWGVDRSIGPTTPL
jgi:3-oxoacyl-[acyl-carrier protein] reductase